MRGVSRQWEVPFQTVDVVGLYLGGSTRILALGLTRCRDHERPPSPILPMDLGISSLLEGVDAVMSLPGFRRHRAHMIASCLNFLAEVDRAAPSHADIHLIRTDSTPRGAVGTRSWVDSERFFVSYLETGELWGDKVVECLGHRAARHLRSRTCEMRRALRNRIDAGADGQAAFSWVFRSADSRVSPVRTLPV